MIQPPFFQNNIAEGTILLDHYEVKDIVPSGYVCRRQDSKADYLLKPVAADLESEDVQELQQAASRISENLIHQNIAHLLSCGQDTKTGVLFNVVQLVQGEKLPRWAKNHDNGVLSVENVIPLLRQIASAIDYAGKKGFHHPALKPDCIIVTPQGEAMINDYDLLALTSSQRKQYFASSPKLAWSVDYMPPEVCQGKPNEAAANQYTLAVIAYELLAGRLPFDNTNTTALLNAIQNYQPNPINSLSDAQNDVFFKALAKQPNERYASCTDFISALETANSSQVVASPAPADTAPLKTFFSNRLNIVLCCILAAFMVLILKNTYNHIHAASSKNAAPSAQSTNAINDTKPAGQTNLTASQGNQSALVTSMSAEEARKAEQAQKDVAEAKQLEEEKKAAEAAKRLAEAKRLEEEKKAIEEAKRLAEAKRLEEEKKAAEARKAAEEAKRLEEAKKAEIARKAAEEAKRLEEERKAEAARKAAEEAKRLEEARKKAAEEEAKRVAEAKRLEEEKKAAEEAKRLAEAKRLEEEKKAAEEAKRLAEAKRLEEEKKAAEEAKRLAEAKRLEEEKKAAEEAKRLAEAKRLEEEKKAAEEAKRLAEEKKKAAEEAKRLAEAKRLEEERKAAEEAKRLEEARKKAAEEEAKRLAEAKRLEEEKKAAEEAKRLAEAKRLEEEKKAAEEAKRLAEAKRLEEEKKAAEEAKRLAEAKRLEEEKKAAEEAKRLAEAKRLEEEKKAAEEAKRIAEAKRLAEEKKAAEEAKRLEEAKKAEEARKKEMLHVPFYAPKYLFAKDVQVFPGMLESARIEIQEKLGVTISQAAAHDQWHRVKELSEKMKLYDTANARHWLQTAESRLAPSVHITSWLDGKEVSAIFLNHENSMTPLRLTNLVYGALYTGDLLYERNGERFTGKISFKVDWKEGEQEHRIMLKSTLPTLELPFQDAPAIQLIKVEAGDFVMGEDNGSADETRHSVRLTKNFWIGRHEISQKQWKAVMGNNPSNFKSDDNPVEGITWAEAMKFCEKLNSLAETAIPEGFKVTLPTEAQWEFAARGGNFSKHFPYSGSDIIDDVAWHSENSNVHTQPVGMKYPNELGLYDMTGNVWEWCLDACEWENRVLTDTYRDNVVDPVSTKGELHIIRGGGWLSSPKNCRISNRLCCDTNFKIYNLGLRIVLVPKK